MEGSGAIAQGEGANAAIGERGVMAVGGWWYHTREITSPSFRKVLEKRLCPQEFERVLTNTNLV